MKPRLFLLQLLWIETFLCGTTTSLSFVTMSAKAATAAVQPKIAVIGGGAAGLAAARAAQNAGWTDITVLEKDARTGGVWNYQTAATDRPVYRGLRYAFPVCPLTKHEANSLTETLSPSRSLKPFCFSSFPKQNQSAQGNHGVSRVSLEGAVPELCHARASLGLSVRLPTAL